MICENEKNNRISLKKYASKLRARAILDSHGCTWLRLFGKEQVSNHDTKRVIIAHNILLSLLLTDSLLIYFICSNLGTDDNVMDVKHIYFEF